MKSVVKTVEKKASDCSEVDTYAHTLQFIGMVLTDTKVISQTIISHSPR